MTIKFVRYFAYPKWNEKRKTIKKNLDSQYSIDCECILIVITLYRNFDHLIQNSFFCL